jgi:hypothetical protein
MSVVTHAHGMMVAAVDTGGARDSRFSLATAHASLTAFTGTEAHKLPLYRGGLGHELGADGGLG